MDQATRQLCRQTANVSARNVLEMALGVEDVVDGGVDRQEALS
jgi:hypothetical protein